MSKNDSGEIRHKPNYLGLSPAGTFYRGKDDWMRALTAADDLSVNAKLVGCYLALRINKNTRDAFPQQTTIAKEIGVSRATVMRAIAELVNEHWMEKKSQGQRGRKRAVNRYAIIMPWAV